MSKTHCLKSNEQGAVKVLQSIIPKQNCVFEAQCTWSSGVSSTVRYAEGLSARNTQGRQDEEDE